MTLFDAIAFAASIVAGAIATVAGFGIGSVMTPLLATQEGMKIAVAAVSIPHVIGTAVRFWMLRGELDRRVLLHFGLMSALGGLFGALLHARITSGSLRLVFAAILIIVGLLGVSGLSDRIRFSHGTAWIGGLASGFLGGLIGNQGGIRAGAMLGFDVRKEAFIATATCVALIVDGVRMPVYLATEGAALLRIWPLIAIVTVGVVIGTIAGRALLGRLPEAAFKRIVSGLVLVLGVTMLVM